MYENLVEMQLDTSRWSIDLFTSGRREITLAEKIATRSFWAAGEVDYRHMSTWTPRGSWVATSKGLKVASAGITWIPSAIPLKIPEV